MILVKTLIIDVIILFCLLVVLVKMESLTNNCKLKEEKRRKKVIKEVNKLYGKDSKKAKETVNALKNLYAERDAVNKQ